MVTVIVVLVALLGIPAVVSAVARWIACRGRNVTSVSWGCDRPKGSWQPDVRGCQPVSPRPDRRTQARLVATHAAIIRPRRRARVVQAFLPSRHPWLPPAHPAMLNL